MACACYPRGSGSDYPLELTIAPVEELAGLRTGPPTATVTDVALAAGAVRKVLGADGDQLDLVLNLSWVPSAVALTFVAAGVRVKVGPDDPEGQYVGVTAMRQAADYLFDTNIPHGDLKAGDFVLPKNQSWDDRTGPAQCVRRCDQLPGCASWTYVRSGGGVGRLVGGNGQPGPRCAIKGNGTRHPSFDPDAISGYKPGHAPSNLTVPNATLLSVVSGAQTMAGHVAQRTVALPGGRAQASLRILVDHSVIEVYDGVSAMSGWSFASAPATATGVQLECSPSTTASSSVLASLDVYAMSGAF